MLNPESRLFIVLLATLTMISSLAIDMSLPALPTLTRYFATTPDRVQLTLSLFLAGYAGAQLFSTAPCRTGSGAARCCCSASCSIRSPASPVP